MRRLCIYMHPVVWFVSHSHVYKKTRRCCVAYFVIQSPCIPRSALRKRSSKSTCSPPWDLVLKESAVILSFPWEALQSRCSLREGGIYSCAQLPLANDLRCLQLSWIFKLLPAHNYSVRQMHFD